MKYFIVILFLFSQSSWAMTCRELSEKGAKNIALGKVPQNSISKERVVEILSYIASLKIKMTSSNFIKDPDGVITQALRDKFGYQAKSSAFYQIAVNRFDSWESALAQAGITHPIASRLSKTRIIEMLKYVASLKLPMNAQDFSADADGKIAKALKEKFGFESQPSWLYRIASDDFATWNNALKAAGIRPKKIPQVNRISEKSVAEMITYVASLDIKMNAFYFQQDPEGKITRALKQKFSYQAQPKSLYQTALSRFGTWEKALKAAGVTPPATQPMKRLDDKELIDMLVYISVRAPQMNAQYFKKDPDGKIGKILVDRFAYSAQPNAFFQAASKRFGSWEKALELAAKKRETNLRRNSWTRESVTETIQALNEMDFSLNYIYIEADPDGAIFKFFKDTERSQYRTKAFLKFAIKEFGSWDAALIAAGINPQMVHKHFAIWTRESAITAIQKISKSNIPLNSSYMNQDPDGRIAKVFKEQEISRFSSASLYEYSIREFGSWSKALSVAGFDPELIRANRSIWNRDNVVTMIQDLNEAKIPLFYNNVRDDIDGRVSDFFLSKQIKKSSYSFFESALREYGSWENALRAAGLEPQRYQPKPSVWTKELIVSTIQRMYGLGMPLNRNSLEIDPHKEIYNFFMQNKIATTRGASLVRGGVREFGSWDQALVAAGLNPDHIRLRGTTPFKFLSDVMKAERAENTSSWIPQQKAFKSVGDDISEIEVVSDIDIEAEFIAQENQVVVDKTIAKLQVDDQKLFNVMILEIEENGLPALARQDLPDYFATKLSERLGLEQGGEKLSSQINALINKLLSEPDLREALFN
jgi:hypothetical protein